MLSGAQIQSENSFKRRIEQVFLGDKVFYSRLVSVPKSEILQSIKWLMALS